MLRQSARIRIGYVRLRRHNILAPDTGAAGLYFGSQLASRTAIACVFFCDLDEFGAVLSFVYQVASKAVIFLKKYLKLFSICMSCFGRAGQAGK